MTLSNDQHREARLQFSWTRKTPVILQGEMSECGLTCLAMVASHFGRGVSLAELRSQFRVSQAGCSAASIATHAEALGLQSKAVRVSLGELRKLKPPAVLHWRMNHFVVLAGIGRRTITIHDPAVGRRKIDWSEIDRCFTGIALEFFPGKSFTPKPAPPKLRLRDLWSSSQGLWGAVARLIVLAVVVQALSLLAPLVSQLVVDEAIARTNTDLLAVVLIGFGLLKLTQVVLEFLRGWAGLFLGQTLSFELQSNLMRHLLRLPAAFFERRHVGDVVSRLDSMRPIHTLLSSTLINMLLDGLLCVATLAMMLLYSLPLASLVVGALGLIFVTRVAAFPYIRRVTEELIMSRAGLNTVVLETIRAIRPVKLFARERLRHERWSAAFTDTLNIEIRLQRFGIVGQAASGISISALDLALLGFGALAVIENKLTLGMLFAFQAWRSQFENSLFSLMRQYFAVRTAGLHLERLAELVTAEPEASSRVRVEKLEGGVRIRNARFRHADDLPWILDGAELTVQAGESIALTGVSGAGKSTVLKLLSGLLILNDGEIVFDDLPLCRENLRAIRAQTGVVMQDDRLLTGSIAENIAFFDATRDRRALVAAAEAAAVADDIRSLPMGFETLIGDMGSALSGGQRQRILLARALYHRPSILLLDEGTANLDASTEGKVLEGLRGRGITRIVVAHRQAAISACDRVVSLQDGQLVEAL